MADYRDKAAKALEPANSERIRKWRREFCKPFTAEQIAELQALSDRVDEMWAAQTEQLARDHCETEDTLPVWGQPAPAKERRTTNSWKDRIRAQGIFSEGTRTASPYRRLKLVMDYWCALWFWPIEAANQLPDRDTFLNEIALVLTGSVYQPGLGPNQTADLFGEEYAEHAAEIAKRISNEIGMLDIDRLNQQLPRLKLVDEIARLHRFHHWELAFSDLFYGDASDTRVRGGFDLVLGNPPWVKIEWEERGILGDYNPILVLRKHSAAQVSSLRTDAFTRYLSLYSAWLSELANSVTTQAFLSAKQNYPLLEGQRTNLYKCFLPQAWMIGRETGVAGFVHPEGVYDDPNGGSFREALYSRLRVHFQYRNELHLFPTVHNQITYSINIYAKSSKQPKFHHISNLYIPSTVDACFNNDGSGTVPGLKDSSNNWNTSGHANRIISVDKHNLATLAILYDYPGTPPLQARLPVLHSRELLLVLEKFAAQSRRLDDLSGEIYVTQHWNETNAQRNGIIKRETRFATEAREVVLSSPGLFVGNPMYKTPRRICETNRAYDVVDLTNIPDDYFPRTNYIPSRNIVEYINLTPQVPWADIAEYTPKRVNEYY